MIPRLDYIIIGESPSGKTLIIRVECNGLMLGIIKWYSNWRRYVFYPDRNTLFDSKCLSNIQLYLERMMHHHKTAS
jgi:hypothetical protein